MAKPQKGTRQKQVKAIEERWTKPLTDAGWTAIPNILLEKQAALGLKPMDLNILLQILKHWWYPESPPFPSVESLSTAIGVNVRTVQKHISRMVDAGLLERQERFQPKGGQKSNAYTFDGLIRRCKPFADEAVAAKGKKRVAEAARIRRKTPLHLVEG